MTCWRNSSPVWRARVLCYRHRRDGLLGHIRPPEETIVAELGILE